MPATSLPITCKKRFTSAKLIWNCAGSKPRPKINSAPALWGLICQISVCDSLSLWGHLSQQSLWYIKCPEPLPCTTFQQDAKPRALGVLIIHRQSPAIRCCLSSALQNRIGCALSHLPLTCKRWLLPLSSLAVADTSGNSSSGAADKTSLTMPTLLL